MKRTLQKMKRKANNFLRILLIGALTGTFAGLIVTLYNLLVVMSEEFSRNYYGFFRENPAFIPLLFLALFLGGILIGGVLRFLPMIRGNGFPQTERATRGLLRMRWYRELTGMFAASLFTVFMGLSAGAEGPSVFIGGMSGYGVSDVLRCDPIVRRYQVTGGACAGLAVALNAPLTGIIFAYEEAHKRFTPEVFVCSFSSVVFAVIVRNLLRLAMGFSVGPFFGTFEFPHDPGLLFCAFALGAAVIVSLVAVGFYRLIFLARRIFRKFTLGKNIGKYTVPFLLAGACGLLTVWVMGGGVEFIDALGSKSEHTVSLFGAPLWAALLTIVAVKLIVTVVNTGADLPCCASVPMMAMGAGLGKLLSLLFIKFGMSETLSDALVVLSLVTFFATVVKAPITGIIMSVELTWSFTFLLPAVICVAIGYLMGDICHTKPLYDQLLDEILERELEGTTRVTVQVRVTESCSAAGRAVRDVLWPFTALVKTVNRAGNVFVPTGKTVLEAGDVLDIEGNPRDPEEFCRSIGAAAGEILSSESGTELPAESPELPHETE